MDSEKLYEVTTTRDSDGVEIKWPVLAPTRRVARQTFDELNRGGVTVVGVKHVAPAIISEKTINRLRNKS